MLVLRFRRRKIEKGGLVCELEHDHGDNTLIVEFEKIGDPAMAWGIPEEEWDRLEAAWDVFIGEVMNIASELGSPDVAAKYASLIDRMEVARTDGMDW